MELACAAAGEKERTRKRPQSGKSDTMVDTPKQWTNSGEEAAMRMLRMSSMRAFAITGLLLVSARPGLAQTPAAPPAPPALAPPLLSLAEARTIIDGALAFTRGQNF